MLHAFIPVKTYFNQYDNLLYPGGSCNMTSLGMALEHYGKTVPGSYARTPDNLLAYCDAQGLDRHDLGVIEQVCRHFGLSDNASYTDTLEECKQWLDHGGADGKGGLVIIQGCFTPSGHVILVNGVSEADGIWCCCDPAGQYVQGSGYDGYLSGQDVRYPAAWFDPAASPDGKVWAHLLG